MYILPANLVSSVAALHCPKPGAGKCLCLASLPCKPHSPFVRLRKPLSENGHSRRAWYPQQKELPPPMRNPLLLLSCLTVTPLLCAQATPSPFTSHTAAEL